MTQPAQRPDLETQVEEAVKAFLDKCVTESVPVLVWSDSFESGESLVRAIAQKTDFLHVEPQKDNGGERVGFNLTVEVQGRNVSPEVWGNIERHLGNPDTLPSRICEAINKARVPTEHPVKAIYLPSEKFVQDVDLVRTIKFQIPAKF